jgi:hypothetical protein
MFEIPFQLLEAAITWQLFLRQEMQFQNDASLNRVG